VNEDLTAILTKFHREVVLPDIELMLTKGADSLLHEMNARFAEVFRRFAALHERFDRLERLR
jgi:hypothetical protein